ncbi:hypothetical protein ACINWC323_2620 [Acinetobacter sp. WC-323]|uniref:SRPBCC family protein n=1 Tax=Acinetobacter sp. WC-323 TaxID=903918 RepID=UPI00029E1AFE|nr:SRPBCC domain-containing protein [Acinetobacter sp. WC-323]EKU56700.1 hypothetical protein ACINWC323_2620 [Acinetobacter sp. WC-323]
METLSYNIKIYATPEKVWQVLWSPESYPEWTKFFACDSTMQSDWKVGGKTYFGDGKGNGMVSTIESLDEPKQVVFKHLGMIQNGQEDLESEEIKTWAGALEKYMLFDFNGETQLHVEVDIQPEHAEFMNKGFDQGLAMVKHLAEKEG